MKQKKKCFKTHSRFDFISLTYCHILTSEEVWWRIKVKKNPSCMYDHFHANLVVTKFKNARVKHASKNETNVTFCWHKGDTDAIDRFKYQKIRQVKYIESSINWSRLCVFYFFSWFSESEEDYGNSKKCHNQFQYHWLVSFCHQF